MSAEYRVRWNGTTSQPFNVQNGVKQGGVVSAYLFSLLMEKLIAKVKGSKIGCHVGNRCVAILVYADDILLLAPSRSAAQALL